MQCREETWTRVGRAVWDKLEIRIGIYILTRVKWMGSGDLLYGTRISALR